AESPHEYFFRFLYPHSINFSRKLRSFDTLIIASLISEEECGLKYNTLSQEFWQSFRRILSCKKRWLFR
ncbi:hypothetical protein, partial [Klebsiella pneumoniae]|uniref:hypothetical protein n=1 Tax=Klebsiella pneumoniae TaxID=573 RepID=UPI001CA45FE1